MTVENLSLENQTFFILNKKLDELTYQVKCLELTGKKALTVTEAARYLGVAKSTLHAIKEEGGIPYFRPIGRKGIYFQREHLDSWMLSNRMDVQLENPVL